MHESCVFGHSDGKVSFAGVNVLSMEAFCELMSGKWKEKDKDKEVDELMKAFQVSMTRAYLIFCQPKSDEF